MIHGHLRNLESQLKERRTRNKIIHNPTQRYISISLIINILLVFFSTFMLMYTLMLVYKYYNTNILMVVYKYFAYFYETVVL